MHSADATELIAERRVKDAEKRLQDISKDEEAQKAALQQNQNQNQGQGQGGRRQQQQQQQQPNPQAQADLAALDVEFTKRKRDAQKSIDLYNKELATAKANQEAAKADFDKATTAATAAHQAWLDAQPAKDASTSTSTSTDAKAGDPPAKNAKDAKPAGAAGGDGGAK